MRVAALVMASLTVAASPANALDFFFDFNFSSTSVTISNVVISATETATSGVWQVDSITGQIGGSAITGLAAASVSGSTLDQRFFFPASSGLASGFFNDINAVTPSSTNGLAFSSANGNIYRVFNNSPTADTFNIIGGSGYSGSVGNLSGLVEIQAVPTPAVGAGLLSLLGAVVFGVAVLRRRRRASGI